MLLQTEKLKHTDSGLFFLLAGPCVIEGENMALNIAETIVKITDRLHIPYVFKGSYRKANRSRIDSFTGIGDEKALKILRKVGETFNIPVVTDIHSAEEARMAAEYADILQIPAFLSRQTDLLVAAAETGRVVNIKKGQFLSPGAMKFAVQKVIDAGNKKVAITERGTTFGYQDLLVDFRGIPEMKSFGYPVILDVTHSLQQPNQTSGVTGGMPQLIETIARAGIATGADGLFMETHPEPEKAKSDGANMLRLDLLEGLLVRLTAIRETINKFDRQFLSPGAMKFAVQKVIDAGNKKVAITERGTTFGYQDLLVDFRGIPEMKSFGYPVILDVTHSLQQPNQTSGVTGGMPQLIETIARAGIATGADGLFMETHPEPEKAKSDGANMLRLDLLEGLLVRLTAIRETINKFDK